MVTTHARHTIGVVAVAALTASLTACGGAQTIDAGDTTVLVSERTRGGMDALLEGTLAVVDGCLGIDTTHHALVVVWPHGTDVTNDDSLTIDLPGVGEITVGEQVSVGGGVDRGGDGRIGGVTIPARCDSTEIWLAR